MDDEKQIVKITERDGELFVDGEETSYRKLAHRTVWVSLRNLKVSSHYVRNEENKLGYVAKNNFIAGDAHLEKETLNILGRKDDSVKQLSFSIQPVSGENIKNAWKAHVGFIAYDWEIGDDDEWYLQVDLPADVVEQICTALRENRLQDLTIGIDADFWTPDYHAPPSVRVSLFIRPDKNGSIEFPESAHGSVRDILLGEQVRPLCFPPRSRLSVDDQFDEQAVNDLVDQGERVEGSYNETEQIRTINKIARAIKGVTIAIAVIAIIILLK